MRMVPLVTLNSPTEHLAANKGKFIELMTW